MRTLFEVQKLPIVLNLRHLQIVSVSDMFFSMAARDEEFWKI